MTTEKYTSVPFRYRARLEHRFKIDDDGSGQITEEKALVTGHIHPKPYDHSEAVAAAQDPLRVFTDNGWLMTDLRVMAYGERE